jgi:hypothetical protein
MLHNIVLILLGLVLFGVLAAILETLGLKNHPYVARLFPRLLSPWEHTSTGVSQRSPKSYPVWSKILNAVPAPHTRCAPNGRSC